MKKILIGCLVVGLFGGSVLAGMLPGGIKGTLDMKYENDQLDADQSVGTTKLTFKKGLTIGKAVITPYVFFENESYGGFFSSNRKESETAVGIDLLAFKNDNLKVTVGTLYEYEDNAVGDNDGLLTYKMKAEF